MEWIENFNKAVNKRYFKMLPTTRLKKQAGICLINRLLDLPGPRTLSKSPSNNKQDQIFAEISVAFGEIMAEWQTLQDIQVYIMRIPKSYKNMGVAKEAYLKYHIRNFLNQVYIIKERLVKFTRKIKKYYNNQDLKKQKLNEIERFILDRFRSVVSIRDLDVHSSKHSDSQLQRMDALSLFKKFPVFDKVLTKHFNTIKKQWLDTIEKVEKNSEIVLNQYFKDMFPFVFDTKHNFLLGRVRSR